LSVPNVLVSPTNSLTMLEILFMADDLAQLWLPPHFSYLEGPTEKLTHADGAFSRREDHLARCLYRWTKFTALALKP